LLLDGTFVCDAPEARLPRLADDQLCACLIVTEEKQRDSKQPR